MLSSTENKIKKRWLYTLCVSSGMSLIFLIITSLSSPNFQSLTNYMGTKMVFLMIALNIIFVLVWCNIYYRCAYKKPGRKLLAFNLILTPLSLIYTILIRLNIFSFIPNKSAYTAYDHICFILGLAINVVFFIFSFKLFKLNKELQNRLVNESKD